MRVRMMAALAAAAVFTAGCGGGSGGSAASEKPAGGKVKIALSNSVISNKWRVEMVNQFKSACEADPWKDQVDCSVFNSGEDVSKQAQQISNLISQRVDAIVVDAASPTGLNSVIKQACDRGILVIAFDAKVTEKCALKLAPDNFEFGQVTAQWVVDQVGGKGNVMMLTGAAGTSIDTERTKGAESVFKQNPGIKIVSKIKGEWDNATAQRNAASVIPTLPQVDAIWGQGGSAGVLKAFKSAGRELPPTTGESENGFRRFMSAQGYEGSKVQALSLGNPTYQSVLALELARQILLEDRKAEGFTVPYPRVTNESLRDGIDVFPDLDDDFYASYTDTAENPLVDLCVESAISAAQCAKAPIVNLPKAGA